MSASVCLETDGAPAPSEAAVDHQRAPHLASKRPGCPRPGSPGRGRPPERRKRRRRCAATAPMSGRRPRRNPIRSAPRGQAISSLDAGAGTKPRAGSAGGHSIEASRLDQPTTVKQNEDVWSPETGPPSHQTQILADPLRIGDTYSPSDCANAPIQTLKRNEDAGFRRSAGVVGFRRKVPLTQDDTKIR